MRFSVAAACHALAGLWWLGCVTVLASCSTTSGPTWTFADIMPKSGPGAVARLSPKNSSSVRGTLTFSKDSVSGRLGGRPIKGSY